MAEVPARRRGRPSRIDRARIVATARAMDPGTLTMQAVAERLGVDRKALNYHVSDRERLLELVAFDTLRDEVAGLSLPVGGDWREVVRAYAYGMRDALANTGALFDYVRMPAAGGVTALEPSERFLRALIAAGFDETTAGRALQFVAAFVTSSARDLVLVRRHGEHPQVSEVRRLLEESGDALPTMRRLAGRETAGADQLDFDLTVFVGGLEKLLAA